jgi:hypothetical protein
MTVKKGMVFSDDHAVTTSNPSAVIDRRYK